MLSKQKIACGICLVALAITTGCGTVAKSATPVNMNNPLAVNLDLPKEPAFKGPIVAKYNGGTLTKEELDQQYNAQVVLFGHGAQESKAQFLQFYVGVYKWMYNQSISAAKTPVNTAEAEQAVEETLQQLVGPEYKTLQDVQNQLKKLNLTQDDLLRTVEKGQILQQYLAKKLPASVSDKQAKAYYEKNKSQFTTVTVDEILVSSPAKALKIIQQLKAGAKFSTLANKYSIDPGVKNNHGTYANQIAAQFVPAFANACVTLPIGQISQPVHTQYGYHVMRVDSRSVQAYSAVAQQLKSQLLSQLQQQSENQLFSTAIASAKIQVVAKSSDL